MLYATGVAARLLYPLEVVGSDGAPLGAALHYTGPYAADNRWDHCVNVFIDYHQTEPPADACLDVTDTLTIISLCVAINFQPKPHLGDAAVCQAVLEALLAHCTDVLADAMAGKDKPHE